MHRNLLLFLAVVLLCSSCPVFAQGQNNTWVFGSNAGIDFNTNTPINTQVQSEAGCASVSSSSGALLFYSDGLKVWDRNHNVMPNGSGLTGNSATGTVQGALIVPFVGDTNKYYLFSLGSYNDNADPAHAGKLYYSVVDRTLNGGNGDVTTQKNILIDTALGSELQAVAGNNCNIWVLVHLKDTNVFKAYSITAAGINTVAPVFSQVGAYTGEYAYRTGMIKISPTRQKIAITNFTIATYSWAPELNVYSCIEIYDFNPGTGQVSNPQVIDSTDYPFVNFYGVCFSPDGSKIYGSVPLAFALGQPGGIFQYDLSLPTSTAIIASKTQVSPGGANFAGDIAAGPNGKLYVSKGFNFTPDPTPDRIDNPNLPGAACVYSSNAVTLNAGTGVFQMFPPEVVRVLQDTSSNGRDTLLCNASSLTLQAPAGYSQYLWQNGSTAAVYTVTTPGIYWVNSQDYCRNTTDTFHVGMLSLASGLPADTSLCGTEFEWTVDADAGNPAGTIYTWQDGSTTPVYTIYTPGMYTVTMQSDGCSEADEVMVTSRPIPQPGLGPDTVLCLGSSYTLEARGGATAAYLWQDGSTKPGLQVGESGVYAVSVTNSGCTGSDTVVLTFEDCTCNIFMPDAFSPNGDGLNDALGPHIDCAAGSSNLVCQLSIYNRWGQRVFISYNLKQRWDGTFNGMPADAGTYFYQLEVVNNRQQPYRRKGEILLLR